tara:strand:+ start:211049 stop:214888 length:3840 start_codon:yes stop_codon:yes gene_type:complete
MKKISQLLLIATLLLSVASCSGGKKTTKAAVTVTVGKLASPSLAAFTGGGMLYGINGTTGDSFAVNLIDVAGPLSLQLVNGDWEFYGFLWDGVGDSDGSPELEGAVKCTYTVESLTGGEVNIALGFSNNNCNNPLFSGTINDNAGTISFAQIGLHSCRDASGTTAAADLCDDTGTGRDKGFIKSYEIVIDSYDTSGLITDVGGSLITSCYNVAGATDGAVTTGDPTLKNIPTGSAGSGLRTRVVAYLDQNCNTVLGAQDIFLDDGLSGPSPYTYTFEGGTNPTKYFQVFHDLTGPEVCTYSLANSYTEFTSGDGSATAPYTICFPEQFDLIGPTDLTASYNLLQDLNFNGREKVIGFDPINCADLRMGNNVVPVGFNCANGVSDLGAFSGTFNGYDYSLNNILIFADDYDIVGLFKDVNGGTITNLTINNSEVEGNFKCGMLAGQVTTGVIENNVIKDSSVDCGASSLFSYAGGLIGSGETGTTIGGTTAVNLVVGTDVRGKGSYVGGIVGQMNGGSVTKAYFDGSVEVQSEGCCAAPYAVGGLVGISFGAPITDSIAKGAVHGNAIKMGGIVGSASGAGANVTDTLANIAVSSHYNESTNTAVDLGGIVGNGDNAGQILQDNIFTGIITDSCQSGTQTTCKIGSIAGTSLAGTVATNFATNDYTTGRGGTTPGSVVTDGSIRNGSDPGFTSAASWSAFVAGEYPRLAWTALFDLPCDDANAATTVANQIGSLGRGSLANPIVICNPDQFIEIASNSSYHYVLEDHINLETVFPSSTTNRIAVLGGSINGRDRVIMGGDVNETGDAANGIIQLIGPAGVVSNLNMVGVSATRTSYTSNKGNGTLAGTNAGTISKVQFNFGKVTSQNGGTAIPSAGGLVGINSGTIKDVNGSVNIDGTVDLGGIVGHNNGGIIQDSSSYMYFQGMAAFPHNGIGGVAGRDTNGTIRRVYFGGDISIEPSATGTVTDIGGIVGIADGSNIVDVYSEDQATINMKYDAINVGGLVGNLTNASTLSSSYNAAEVRYGWCVGGSSTGMEEDQKTCITVAGPPTWTLPTTNINSIGPVVGANSASTIDADVFFVNKAYTLQITGMTIATGTVNGTECDLTNSAINENVAVGDGIFIGNHNRYFDITSPSASGSTVASFEMDIGGSALGVDCTDTTSTGYFQDDGRNTSMNFTITKPNANVLGTRVFDLEMQDPNTFCADTFTGDPTFVCSSGWDIVLDTADFNGDLTEGDVGDGFDRLVDWYFYELGYDPVLDYTTPTWSLEPDEGRYPRLVRND